MYKKAEKTINDIFYLRLSDKVIDKINIISIIVLMISLLIPRFISEIHYFRYNENIYNYLYIICIIPFIYVLLHNIKNRRVKYKLDFYLVILMLIVCLISTLLSSNFKISFMGSYIRKDGFLTIIFYALSYINATTLSNKKDILILINTFFIIGIIQTIFGFIQVYTPYNFINRKSFEHMAYGLCGNPNFYATLMLILSSLGLFICLFYKHTKFYIISTVISYMGLILAASSGPFFTFLLILLVLLIVLELNKGKLLNKLIIWLAIFVSLYAGINYSAIYVNKTYYHARVNESSTISWDINYLVGNAVNKITGKEIYIKTGNNNIDVGRIDIWRSAYQTSQDNLMFGVGLDNYSLIVKQGNRPIMVDKTHNVYLNILVTTGIFSLIIFVALIIILHIKVLTKKNVLSKILLIVFIGYNIQALFNINVIYVSFYYYVLAGIMVGLTEKS